MKIGKGGTRKGDKAENVSYMDLLNMKKGKEKTKVGKATTALKNEPRSTYNCSEVRVIRSYLNFTAGQPINFGLVALVALRKALCDSVTVFVLTSI